MALAASLFYVDVQVWTIRVLALVCLIVELIAFANCLPQRSDAFLVVGRIPKGAWLAILVGAIVLTLLFGAAHSFLAMIGVAAALIYLLDLRPALRDAVEGGGSW